MAGGASGFSAVVSDVEVSKNAVVDLRLVITLDSSYDPKSYVVVIQEVVQCALLMLERGAHRFLSDPANQDLSQTLVMVALDTARCHGAKSDQVTCDVRHVAVVLKWAVESYSGINVLVLKKLCSLMRS